MKVAFRLRRLAEPAPATALLLLSQRAKDVVRLCVDLGGDRFPEIFPVADGLLVRLSGSGACSSTPGLALTGMIALRNLSENLFLPVDAELIPALLEDEAASLGKRRGLVFLPGGRVLAFNPDAPLPSSAFLALPNLRRENWKPLPDRPPLADRLSEITLEQPEPPPEVILEMGGEGIGTDDPRPEESGAPARALGNTAYGLGKALAWLGTQLHLRGLARAGANLMNQAMNLAPRLSEALLGQQEASLRDLLREFREGNIERALRRALPLGGDTARGAAPAQTGHLPINNILYSLQDLLGGDRRPAGIWFSRFDAWRELEKEYRKQAELAVQRGDYRRAAFIYGKLLRDFRSAAAALSQGGLHRDAAILYLARLHDPQAAAREFEAAGEIDRALDLYRKRGDLAAAGDLLRRAGEEERALEEYRQAALKLAGSGQDYEAGELLLTRAQRPDLAAVFYQAGWDHRPYGAPISCAIRLAQHHGQQEARHSFIALVTEAEGYLATQGSDMEASEFFNEIARLADRPALASLRDDVRDRALMGIATRMRQRAPHARSGDVASALLTSSAGWDPAQVSDACFAVKAAAFRPPVEPDVKLAEPGKAALTCTALPTRGGVVRAVCQAPQSGDLFIGFSTGELFCFRPQRGEASLLHEEADPICSLATDPQGTVLVTLRISEADEGRLTTYRQGRVMDSRVVDPEGYCTWLAPLIQENCVVWYKQDSMHILDVFSLLPSPKGVVGYAGEYMEAAVLLPSPGPSLNLLALRKSELVYFENMQSLRTSAWSIDWAPPEKSGPWHPVVSGLRKNADNLELAAIGKDGVVFWADVEINDGALARVDTRSHAGSEPFVAVALVAPRLIVAVTRHTIQWLRRSGSGFRRVSTQLHDLGTVIACYPYHRGNELLLVCEDGRVARAWNLRH
jgi:tetratricopeptide (TPR) repeat protein